MRIRFLLALGCAEIVNFASLPAYARHHKDDQTGYAEMLAIQQQNNQIAAQERQEERQRAEKLQERQFAKEDSLAKAKQEAVRYRGKAAFLQAQAKKKEEEADFNYKEANRAMDLESRRADVELYKTRRNGQLKVAGDYFDDEDDHANELALRRKKRQIEDKRLESGERVEEARDQARSDRAKDFVQGEMEVDGLRKDEMAARNEGIRAQNNIVNSVAEGRNGVISTYTGNIIASPARIAGVPSKENGKMSEDKK